MQHKVGHHGQCLITDFDSSTEVTCSLRSSMLAQMIIHSFVQQCLINKRRGRVSVCSCQKRCTTTFSTRFYLFSLNVLSALSLRLNFAPPLLSLLFAAATAAVNVVPAVAAFASCHRQSRPFFVEPRRASMQIAGDNKE